MEGVPYMELVRVGGAEEEDPGTMEELQVQELKVMEEEPEIVPRVEVEGVYHQLEQMQMQAQQDREEVAYHGQFHPRQPSTLEEVALVERGRAVLHQDQRHMEEGQEGG